ncbi:hypothetical protein [Pseudomonas viridiflava]|uniref:hypothetical protein n=1 Tax=Pseudomonas viridiflava TaxID=33069 RepID=UPI000F03DF97|nr:hypothetical protein [Pseudomonas viridiflava]
MSKHIVTFTKNWRGYAAGETAGFPQGTAEALVESGYATEAGKKSRKAPKPAAKPSEETKQNPIDPPENDEKP